MQVNACSIAELLFVEHRQICKFRCIGNDVVQSLITGSSENRGFTHGRISLALGWRLEA